MVEGRRRRFPPQNWLNLIFARDATFLKSFFFVFPIQALKSVKEKLELEVDGRKTIKHSKDIRFYFIFSISDIIFK